MPQVKAYVASVFDKTAPGQRRLYAVLATSKDKARLVLTGGDRGQGVPKYHDTVPEAAVKALDQSNGWTVTQADDGTWGPHEHDGDPALVDAADAVLSADGYEPVPPAALTHRAHAAWATTGYACIAKLYSADDRSPARLVVSNGGYTMAIEVADADEATAAAERAVAAVNRHARETADL